MPTEELKTFINKMRAAGKTDLEIIAELKTAGWPDADILVAVGSETQPPPPVSPTKPKSKIWFWVVIVLAAIGFGSYLTLRILPYILAWSLKKQGTAFVTYSRPTSSPSPPTSSVVSSTRLIAFPNNIIQLSVPDSWYTKKEMGGQNSYQMQFAYKTDPDESEDYPEYAMQATVTYPAGQTSEINNLNGVVAYFRLFLTNTADNDKVKAADSTSDFSQNLQSTTNTTFLPGKIDILADKDLAVAGLPGHLFEYNNEINKIINKKEKDPSGKFVESTVNVHRVEHVRDLIVFDRQNNLIVIEFKATDSSWPIRVGDFNKITSSLAILYK